MRKQRINFKEPQRSVWVLFEEQRCLLLQIGGQLGRRERGDGCLQTRQIGATPTARRDFLAPLDQRL